MAAKFSRSNRGGGFAGRTKASIALIIALAGLGGFAAPAMPPARAEAPAPTAQAAPLAIGVLPFENLTGRSNEAWIGLSLAEGLIGVLSRLPGVRLIERTQLQALLKELSFSQSALADTGQAPALGRLAGAQRLILGSYELSGARVTLRARMLETATGQIVPGSAVELSGPQSELSELQARLAQTLAGMLREAPLAPMPSPARSQALSLYHQGLHLLESGIPDRRPEAEALFHQALARDPNLAEASLGLARVALFQASDAKERKPALLREALRWTDAALRTDPGLRAIYPFRAWAQSDLGDAEAAAATLEQALIQYPGDFDLITQLVQIRHEPGTTVLPPERLMQVLAELGADLSSPEVQTTLGIRMVDTLMESGATDFSEARALLQKARQQRPLNPELPLKIATAYLGEDNPDTAGIYLGQALAMEPDNFWVRIQVANLYQQSEFAYHEREQPKQATEALERAKTHYRKALEIYPRYTHGYVHLARVHESLGEPDTARELLDQALVIDPEAPYIWIETGRMYARQKQHARAIEAFEHAAALIASRSEPQGLHSMLDYSLAEAYLATHQPDKALPLLESLRANPGFASVAEMRLLEFYRDRKDYAKALELYASLFSREPASKQEPYYARGYRQTWLLAQLQSRPNAPELLNDLGQLAQEEGNEQAAADYFQRALAADPAHPVIRYNLGSLYLTQQQPALALPHLQAALSQQPRYPKAAYNLALVYIALGQPEQAKPLLQQVLSWEPGHAEARQTLSALTR